MTVAMRLGLGLGLVVSVVARVLDGGVARLLMRVVAVATEQVPAFSVEATLGTMLIFSITAVPLGVTPKLTSRRAARFIAGALGTLMLGFFTTTIGVQEVTNANGPTTLHRLGLAACVTGLAAVVLLRPGSFFASSMGAGPSRPSPSLLLPDDAGRGAVPSRGRLWPLHARQISVPVVAEWAMTFRRGYTPPQQEQRCIPAQPRTPLATPSFVRVIAVSWTALMTAVPKRWGLG